MSPLPAWAGVAFVAVFLLATLTLLHFAKRRCTMGHETSRKIMHLAMGAATLMFPVLFHSPFPALIIAAMTIAVLALLRSGALGTRASGLIHGVARRSEGDLYFPVSAALLFALAHTDNMLFVIPILTLTLADPAAAYVGRRIGRTRFATVEARQEKSVEGSAAFLAVALICAFVPLIVGAGLTAAAALLTAATFAVVVTVLEAASWRGLDNLFIPVGGYLLLHAMAGMDVRQLATLFAVTVAMVAVVASLPPRHSTWHGALTLLRARRALP
jgi:phytol kinase